MSAASPLVAARLAFATDGTPYSEEYGDVYHATGGAEEQARHVFLGGNGLPERWRGRRAFTILEAGFGLGLSFAATLRAWREDPQRSERLHFVSIEKHPFTAGDLAQLAKRYPQLEEIAARWPTPVPGMHRLEFGNAVLTVFLGDIADGLPQLQLAADAIYLDGFASAKNPAMWEPRLLRHLGRLAAPGATVATWSVTDNVIDAIRGAGFAVEKKAGFGTKRHMLAGHLIRKTREVRPREERKAIVIGAGVAGAAVGERLASRGWQVTLIERHDGPAREASGNPAAAFHPIVSPDDSLLARFTRAAYVFLLDQWRDLRGLEWSQCGVLQGARDAHELESQRRAVATLGFPADYVSFDEARGGLWFPRAGWVKPASLIESLLSRFPVETRYGREAHEISRKNEWQARDKDGQLIASAPVLVLANAADALRLSPQPAIRVRKVRGQLTFLPALKGLDHIFLRGGMALPGIDGRSLIGASFDVDDPDTAMRVDSHAGNLARLEQMLPGASLGADPEKLEGRVAFRAVVRDRLPIAGPLGLGLYGAFAYGSRGMLWAGLCAELIASQLEGEPLPVERKLAAAVDPGRFALREGRKATAGRA